MAEGDEAVDRGRSIVRGIAARRLVGPSESPWDTLAM